MSTLPGTLPLPAIQTSTDVGLEGFDIDERELIHLYQRIPPPALRALALTKAREKVVTDVARKVKEDGVFDSFRKNLLKDLETQPQFQNLMRRVEIRCTEFLKDWKWSPDMNKTQLREKLQRFVEGFDFVDEGIRGLLKEVSTGVFANPIPAQRFEEDVTRIVGECVQRCIENCMPDFPRLRNVHGGLDQPEASSSSGGSGSALYRQDSVGSDPAFSTKSDEVRRSTVITKEHHRSSRSKSPDVVDMEISSPESSNMDLDELPASGVVPTAPAGKPDEDFMVNAQKAAATPPPPPPVLPSEGSDDRVEGALVLLMLASGQQDWNDGRSSVEKQEGSSAGGTSSPVDTTDATAGPKVALDSIPLPPVGQIANTPSPPESTKSDASFMSPYVGSATKPPTPAAAVAAAKVDILVTTDPVSADASPNRDLSPITPTDKSARMTIPDTTKRPPSVLDALFDPIESESDEDKLPNKAAAKLAKNKGNGQAAASSSAIVVPNLEPTRSDSPKVTEKSKTDTKPIIIEPFQARITKIATEKLPASQARGLKRTSTKTDTAASKRAKAVAANESAKKEQKGEVPEQKERPKFVPVITDFTLDPSPSAANVSVIKTVEKSPPAPAVEKEKDETSAPKKLELEASELEGKEIPDPSFPGMSEARPTRQRKTNTKYCNDAFVSVPPLPKRGPATSKRRSDAVQNEPFGGEESSSPGHNMGDVEGRGNGKKRRKQ